MIRDMKSSTGRWVGGADFFDRDAEVEILETRVRQGNHVLLTGQRRMGKTSVARELGRRLADEGWIFLFADVEAATCPEDAVAEIAQAAFPVLPKTSRFLAETRRWVSDMVDEVGAYHFRLKFRAGLNSGSWRRYGEQLFQDCAALTQPVLVVIDELPIFLKRMLANDGSAKRIDEFLSWLRAIVQSLGDQSPVLIVSGSIGLQPLVNRLGIPDRINHLYTFRLGPWDQETSIECIESLAQGSGLRLDARVASSVYEKLGIGIPHHVQSFFARLHDFATKQGRNRLRLEDVEHVYRNELLGPPGQNDLIHYLTRLKEGLGDDNAYTIAMEILAEAATEGAFTPEARSCLQRLYSPLGFDDAAGTIVDVIEILEHDGYVEACDDGHRISSNLLRDWWNARFRDHHIPLMRRHRSDAHEV